MDLLLHVGSQKTATTALQKMLVDNRDKLAAKGWLYPKSATSSVDPSHNLLAYYFFDGYLENRKSTPFSDILLQLKKEMNGAEKVVISSELLEKCPQKLHARFQEFLNSVTSWGYRIRIMYIVRRQDHIIDSIFKQMVRGYESRFLGRVDKFVQSQAEHLKFASNAALWKNLSQISEIKVLSYTEGTTSDTLKRVLQYMGFDDLAQSQDNISVANPSLDGEMLRLKHLLNRYEYPVDFNRQFLKASFSDRLPRDMGQRITLFTDKERNDFLNLFYEDISRLCTEFGVSREAFLGKDLKRKEAVFVPMRRAEVSSAADIIGLVDRGLADQIVTLIKSGHHRKLGKKEA